MLVTSNLRASRTSFQLRWRSIDAYCRWSLVGDEASSPACGGLLFGKFLRRKSSVGIGRLGSAARWRHTMASKKLEEKYQKILKDCQKRPENRHCADCSSRGNQYVVLNFHTFVCTGCSGIHREMQHKIKSVREFPQRTPGADARARAGRLAHSVLPTCARALQVGMSTFSIDEIKAIDAAGNKVGQATWMAKYNPSDGPIPNEGDTDKIRAHVKDKYARPACSPPEVSEKAEPVLLAPRPGLARASHMPASSSAALSTKAHHRRRRTSRDLPDVPPPPLARHPPTTALAGSGTKRSAGTMRQACLPRPMCSPSPRSWAQTRPSWSSALQRPPRRVRPRPRPRPRRLLAASAASTLASTPGLVRPRPRRPPLLHQRLPPR